MPNEIGGRRMASTLLRPQVIEILDVMMPGDDMLVVIGKPELLPMLEHLIAKKTALKISGTDKGTPCSPHTPRTRIQPAPRTNGKVAASGRGSATTDKRKQPPSP